MHRKPLLLVVDLIDRPMHAVELWSFLAFQRYHIVVNSDEPDPWGRIEVSLCLKDCSHLWLHSLTIRRQKVCISIWVKPFVSALQWRSYVYVTLSADNDGFVTIKYLQALTPVKWPHDIGPTDKRTYTWSPCIYSPQNTARSPPTQRLPVFLSKTAGTSKARRKNWRRLRRPATLSTIAKTVRSVINGPLLARASSPTVKKNKSR